MIEKLLSWFGYYKLSEEQLLLVYPQTQEKYIYLQAIEDIPAGTLCVSNGFEAYLPPKNMDISINTKACFSRLNVKKGESTWFFYGLVNKV